MDAERRQREERKQARVRGEHVDDSDQDGKGGDDGMDSDDSFM